MEALVTLNDLLGYKYISDSIRNSAIWPQFVIEAQLLDIKPFIGDPLLSEINDQASTSPTSFTVLNKTLLDGGRYTYDSKSYLFQGLKACIIYYAFARFESKGMYNHTAMGIVVKASDYSDPASDKAIQRLSTENTMIADAIRDELILYLTRNYTLYPLFESCYIRKQNRTWQIIGD